MSRRLKTTSADLWQKDIVIEHVSGVSLRAELQRNGAFAPTVAAEWFEQIAACIDASHARGIVHRALRPENIIGVRDDRGRLSVKIIDAGLAGRHSPDGVTTQAERVAGTIGYLAPEQMLGQQVDVRCDIFAAGVMLAEMLTGARPFAGTTVQQVSCAVLHDDYHLPMTNPAAQMLDAALQGCLAKRPQDRWDSIGAVRRELLPCLHAYVAASHSSTHTSTATTPPVTQSIQ